MSQRKIVDIYIPAKKEKKKEPVVVTKKQTTKKKKKLEPVENFAPQTKKPKKKNFVWIFGTLAVLFVAIFFVFSLSKAEITYWPETEDVSVETTLTIDISTDSIDVLGRMIPGTFFESEKTITETFPASGRASKEGKASGKITVYNEYSTDSQTLIATTRFISTDGQIFRTPTKVVIPGGHYEGGKLVAGEKEIEVVADESGPDYNIGPSTFSIPGFAGTARYTKFYAKSFQSMVGGFLTGASYVTEDDLQEAEELTANEAEVAAEDALKLDLSSANMSEYMYIENALDTEVDQEGNTVQAGQEINEFNYTAKAKTKTIVFKREDFDDFVKEFLLTRVMEGMAIYEESIKADYVQENINLESGKIILSLSLSAKAYAAVDNDALKQMVSGKSAAGTKIIVENQIGEEKAEVKLWPFWVKKTPQNLDKIKLEMEID